MRRNKNDITFTNDRKSKFKSKSIKIYTDGSCNAKTRNGGYGLIVPKKDYHVISSHHDTTSNRMEVSAIIHALQYTSAHTTENFTIFSDSKYAINSVSVWQQKWFDGNFNLRKKDLLNPDLMKEGARLYRSSRNVEFRWVRGHAGVLGNEIADVLALFGYSIATKGTTYTYVFESSEELFMWSRFPDFKEALFKKFYELGVDIYSWK